MALECTIRASSVLPPKSEHSAANMLSADSSLAWYSSHLTTDHDPTPTKSHKVRVSFPTAPSSLSSINLTFQGGFVGLGGSITIHYADPDTSPTLDCSAAPDSPPWGAFDDVNDVQTFLFPDQAPSPIKHIELEFSSSTDFYGRVIIYALEVFA